MLKENNEKNFAICPNCGKKIADFSDGTDFIDALTHEYVATVCDKCYGGAHDDSVFKSICGGDYNRILIARPAIYVMLGYGFRGFYEVDRPVISAYARNKMTVGEAKAELEHEDIDNAEELMRSYAEYDRRMQTCSLADALSHSFYKYDIQRRYIVVEEDNDYGISVSDVYKTLTDAKAEMKRRLVAYFEKYHLEEGNQNDASDMSPDKCILHGNYSADDYSLEIRETMEK